MRITAALFLIVALCAIGAAPARGALPDPAQILKTSRVPVVHGMTVTYAECPAEYRAVGCVLRADSIIIDVSLLGANSNPVETVPPILFHEAGHVFAQHVGPGVVHRFARISHNHVTVNERFADAYMACALGWAADTTGWHTGGLFPTGYDYDPSPRQHRLVCAMLRRAGARL